MYIEWRVEKKRDTHPNRGQGSPFGYILVDETGRKLPYDYPFVVGKTYRFYGNTETHPFYVTEDEVGAIADGKDTLSLTEPVQSATRASPVTWTPTERSLVVSTYIQCANHPRMGYELVIVAADTNCFKNRAKNGAKNRASDDEKVVTRNNMSKKGKGAVESNKQTNLLAMDRISSRFWNPERSHVEFGEHEWVSPVDVRFAKRFVYVAEQRGYVWRVARDTCERQLILDLTRYTDTLGWKADQERFIEERGLLSFALSPNFERDRHVFVYYSRRIPVSELEQLGGRRENEFNMSSVDHVDCLSVLTWKDESRLIPLKSERVLLTNVQENVFHNGGDMFFDAEGLLWLALGDDGRRHLAGDPASWSGSLLRIDVSRTGKNGVRYSIPRHNARAGAAAPEVVAYGVRNVWGMSQHPTTRAITFADVGEHEREEINSYHFASSSSVLPNFGWPRWEGTLRNRWEGTLRSRWEGTLRRNERMGGAGKVVEPIIEYTHRVGQAVIGGDWVRDHRYIFGDYSGQLFEYDSTQGNVYRVLHWKSAMGHIKRIRYDDVEDLVWVLSSFEHNQTGKGTIRSVNV